MFAFQRDQDMQNNRQLINSNPTKSDEADVEGMCLLLRLGKLKRAGLLPA